MVQSKLPNTTSSSFSSICQLIEETGALDMAIGKTDFKCPQELLDLAVKYFNEGYNNYAPLEGIYPLRKGISDMIKMHYGHEFNPKTEVTVTAGTIQAIHTAISSVVKDDDEVIIFEPAFESFAPSIVLNGGRPVYVRLKAPAFKIDWEELRKMVTSKTKMIILNSPHNPTGSVLSENDLLQLQRLTNGTNIIVLSDEIFESIIFDNQIHQSVSRFEKLIERSFIVSSFGPLYNVNGWGISYCVAPEKLMREFRKMQQIQIYNVNTPLQYALADFLPKNMSFEDTSELYQGKRNYFNRLLDGSLYQVIPAQGGYFQLLDYSNISDETDVEFSERLARDFGIATMPASAFYHEKGKSRYVRICFAKENSTLEQAAERLLQVPSTTAL
ncbi:methionine aminotransferase [Sunxiuqinia elliptica]|uniref:Methionine aminotransferase n=1 Tax=Sunxiuqinia elliptica TaxID=655355 RepID=A0A1I2ATG4_9BACT|nr:methionine aminotransferase [Sunxiuqinia elliptica]SFE47116.1 methionine aminotransferase [Sunxiuqinia elliptica]